MSSDLPFTGEESSLSLPSLYFYMGSNIKRDKEHTKNNTSDIEH